MRQTSELVDRMAVFVEVKELFRKALNLLRRKFLQESGRLSFCEYYSKKRIFLGAPSMYLFLFQVLRTVARPFLRERL